MLATGERGIGWAPIFGTRRLTLAEFELYSYIQQRVMLASTEDGQKEIRTSRNVRKAIKLEELEQQGQTREVPLDFSRMTPEQFERWQKEQEALLN